MNRRQNAFLNICIIAGIFMIFTLADLVKPDRLYSETERRVLASRPVFSREKLFSGAFAGEYETYVTDQFVSHDKWITIKTQADILSGKKEINGIYLGKEEYLFEQHLPQEYTTELENRRIALLQDLVVNWDAQVMLAPTADNVLTDKLPGYVPYYDQAGFLRKVQAAVGSHHYIDVYSALMEHAEEPIYYRTDHHWTSLGASYAFFAWEEAVRDVKAHYNFRYREPVSDSFLGTLQSAVNLNRKPDTIEYFPETKRQKVTITYDGMRTSTSYYEESYLSTRNQYGFFLDDNHGLVEIDTDCHNGKTLFLIKDSYANCMIPMFGSRYEKIYVLDLRYFNGRLYPFMKQYEPEEGMDVLVLYNCIHFLEDFKYVK